MQSKRKENRWYNLAFWGLIFAGSLLWLLNWWPARSLFIDEANVARNLYDRSFAELLLPLDYQQYAPPFFLLLAKACGELFGYGERALRLPAMLGGFLAVWCLARMGQKLKLGMWALLPLALLFFNPTVLRYVGELKPYALDLGVASLLLLLALSWPKPDWRWALVGSLAVWFSLPAVFVLAAIPLPLLYRAEKREWLLRWTAVVSCWLSSFAALYWWILRPSIGKSLLTTFHAPYFFPLPFREYFSWEQVFRLLQEQPRLAFGFTAFAIIWGAALAALGSWSAKRTYLVWFLLPLLLVFTASSFEKYSLIPRLMLFTLPAWWLLAALGTKTVGERKSWSKYSTYLLLAGWVVVLVGGNTLRHYASPMRFSDARKLVTEIRANSQPVLHDSAVPGYDYYRRIHPATADKTAILTASELTEQPRSGAYVVLYDVLTKDKNKAKIYQDSTWAAKQGAIDIRIEELYRSARLYVRYPESD